MVAPYESCRSSLNAAEGLDSRDDDGVTDGDDDSAASLLIANCPIDESIKCPHGTPSSGNCASAGNSTTVRSQSGASALAGTLHPGAITRTRVLGGGGGADASAAPLPTTVAIDDAFCMYADITSIVMSGALRSAPALQIFRSLAALDCTNALGVSPSTLPPAGSLHMPNWLWDETRISGPESHVAVGVGVVSGTCASVVSGTCASAVGGAVATGAWVVDSGINEGAETASSRAAVSSTSMLSDGSSMSCTVMRLGVRG